MILSLMITNTHFHGTAVDSNCFFSIFLVEWSKISVDMIWLHDLVQRAFTRSRTTFRNSHQVVVSFLLLLLFLLENHCKLLQGSQSGNIGQFPVCNPNKGQYKYDSTPSFHTCIDRCIFVDHMNFPRASEYSVHDVTAVKMRTSAIVISYPLSSTYRML